MTDFHTHLLPGMDDGSDSAATSLLMLDMWRRQGIDRVIATPHFYAEYTTPERFLRRRAQARKELTEAMAGQEAAPALRYGAEVRFFDGISGAEALPSLCLEGTGLLLLEMPFTRWTERMLGEVEEIRMRGIRPVIAHLERYIDFNPKKLLYRLMEMDVFIQCNAEYFLSRRTSRQALRLMEEDRIHFLGSDAHNTTSRPPNLGQALELIERKLGRRAIDRLLDLEKLTGVDNEAVKS